MNRQRFIKSREGKVLNRDFFGFLSGFLSLIFVSLVSVFVAGYYKTETATAKDAIERRNVRINEISGENNGSRVGSAVVLSSSTPKR